jgi:hypothetical protein
MAMNKAESPADMAVKMPKATKRAAISERPRGHKARNETVSVVFVRLASSAELLIFFFYSLREYFVSLWNQLFVVVVVVVAVTKDLPI